jgi:single-strand selective monofunctional uracil DNA glycosylase
LPPDRLPKAEREPLFAACDDHLREAVALLRPEWIIGVGLFAESRAQRLFGGSDVKIGRILHPAARGWTDSSWAAEAAAQLRALGVWK